MDSDELREWADKHADAGHHGVAHVLYKAAEGIESVTEQHDREVAARAWAECSRWHAEQGMPVHGAEDEHNPYRQVTP